MRRTGVTGTAPIARMVLAYAEKGAKGRAQALEAYAKASHLHIPPTSTSLPPSLPACLWWDAASQFWRVDSACYVETGSRQWASARYPYGSGPQGVGARLASAAVAEVGGWWQVDVLRIDLHGMTSECGVVAMNYVLQAPRTPSSTVRNRDPLISYYICRK